MILVGIILMAAGHDVGEGETRDIILFSIGGGLVAGGLASGGMSFIFHIRHLLWQKETDRWEANYIRNWRVAAPPAIQG
jgi:hypothetical protein